MPRYYKDRIYSDDQRERIAFVNKLRVAQEQKKAIQEQGDAYWKNRQAAIDAAIMKQDYQNKNRDRL